MVRTKNQIRGSKSKGASFEYDCQTSLKPSFPDIYRTSERGFQLQYDLQSDLNKTVFECKRHKKVSWNEAKKYFLKLKTKAPEYYTSYLLFKPNRQPCLVMYGSSHGIIVSEFENLFRTPFIKHKSTRNRGGKNDD